MTSTLGSNREGALHQFSPDESAIFIIKLGGSLISDKNGYCAANLESIREFARVIHSRWHDLQGRLVVLLGGGSFGSGVACRYNLQNSSQRWNLGDLSIVTLKMFELLSLVTEIFRGRGIPCFPFQASGYLTSMGGRPDGAFLGSVERALHMGLLPILSGDVIFDTEIQFVIFSSDWMPQLFVDVLPIRRVVILTDVPGLMDYTVTPSRVISRVTKENRNLALQCAGPSGKQDVSGGMKNKLEAMLSLSTLGVESVICDGRVPDLLIQALFDPSPAGTLIERDLPSVDF